MSLGVHADIMFDSLLLERLQLLTLVLLLGICASYIAWKRGFFSLSSVIKTSLDDLFPKGLIAIFSIFLFIELILVPLLSYFWLSFQAGRFLEANDIKIDSLTQGWLNIFAIIASAVGVIGFTLLVRPSIQKVVWGPSDYTGIKQVFFDLWVGFLAWFISYPFVVAASQIVALIMELSFHYPHIDQVAVRHLKMTLTHPILFGTTVFSIVFVVPIVEEILFRGFLQTWLKSFLGPTKAIAAASIIFAAFHFSSSQGWDNVELLCSLFILSCFLGFLYERQRSLWAPIGLHVIFNAISISLIVIQQFNQ